jgi:hypothetical protein
MTFGANISCEEIINDLAFHRGRRRRHARVQKDEFRDGHEDVQR